MIELGWTLRGFVRSVLAATAVASVLFCPSGPAGAQSVREVFQKVVPSVAVIRARGRDVAATGQTRFAETGSGVQAVPTKAGTSDESGSVGIGTVGAPGTWAAADAGHATRAATASARTVRSRIEAFKVAPPSTPCAGW